MLTAGSTGRIEKPLVRTARQILFQRNTKEQIDHDLPHICRIDLAHVLMLARQKIVETVPARNLLNAIQRLTDTQMAALKTRDSLRGLFLLYETYLIETQGPKVGGILQTGRSRNDLNATLIRLRLRQPYTRLIHSILRLQAVLMRQARAYASIVMPAYTHGQAAEPITYGHYLAAVAEGIRRDLDGLLDAAQEIDTSPLGAGAIAGTSFPIHPETTAELLGFTRLSRNSVDAVASRDLILRLLAAMAIHGATLSRIATDLLQWLTAEFGFLTLPDELVGSSSVMPQKRNPFLLEHVQGRTASALGAFTHALGATRTMPFSNSIAVGTESVRPVWGALSDITDAAILLRLVVSGAKPCPDRMLQRAYEGFTNATAIATRLVVDQGMDFRSAHRMVGERVTQAVSEGMKSLGELEAAKPDSLKVSLNGMDPSSCVARSRYGGGPAPENVKGILEILRKDWLLHYRLITEQARRWAAAQRTLDSSVRDFCSSSDS